MKKYVMVAIMTLLLTVLGACGNKNEASEQNSNDESEQADTNEGMVDEEELVADDKVVAIVNGKDILGKTYNAAYIQFKMTADQMERDVDANEMKQSIIDSIIDRELLIQQAEKEDIMITDKEIEEEFDHLKETNEDNLTNLMEQYQMSEKEFKEQLRFEIVLRACREKIGSIGVTDQEVEDYYKEAKESNDELPPLEAIEPELKKQLKAKKVNEAIQEKIDKEKEKADIEKKMEV